GLAFYKNSYVGRTFIKPTQKERESSVRLKLSVLEPAVKGKDIVLVDDSIVRGTTIANLIHLLKHAGAGKVHVRISSPPFLYPCYFGTDVPSNQQLIASSHSVEEIRQLIGADSLGYMKIEDLQYMVGNLPLCKACFDNHYPMEIPPQVDFD
ncbi:MAG: amidophosphoribosyltransferase, partial [Oliverpabstia sp.]|nr:amidophosphoribosyltransferase [Oliverpabstia sp.]